MNEEELFDMLDGINPKNLVKYLDCEALITAKLRR
jgi:hypothetical protein